MKIFINVGALVGAEVNPSLRKVGDEISSLNILHDAWLSVNGERIAAFGSMRDLNSELLASYEEVVDLQGGWVFPSFCDSHTHIVYAGNRATEWLDKINGLSYEEIGKRGGGILNSADLLHDTSEDELYRQAMERVAEMIAKGTGAIEIKSGYGLNTQDELKMLRVIRKIKETTPAIVRATFLGAHAVGRKYFLGIPNSPERAAGQAEYVELVCNEMIPEVGRQKLADYVDVFCDKGYFTPEQTERICNEAAKYGMIPKIHANELAVSGGVEVGVKCNALSVDHLENAGPEQFAVLKGSRTMPTLLPGCSFFSNLPFGDARVMIASGLGMAMASDYNPGSSPSGDMRFVAALGCIRLRLTPQQALNATTINSAYAMGISEIAGTITPGKIANFYLTKPLPSLEYYLYAYQTQLISRIFLRGCEVTDTYLR